MTMDTLLSTTAEAPTVGPTPSFRLVRSTTQSLTADLAEKFATMTPSPTERPLNPSRVRYLRAKIEAGLAVSFQWAFAKYLGTVYRMNAQHSSNVLHAMNRDGAFPEGLFAHVDEFEVNSLEALALLFRQYDDRKSSRSLGDVAGGYQGLYPELNSVPRWIGKIGIEAVTWFNKNIDGISVPAGDDQFARFSDRSLYPYLQWLAEVDPAGTLKHVPLVAAMFGTYNAAQAEAEAFWEAVANGGIEMDSTAPASALYNWLEADARRELNVKIKPPGYYQGAIYCWNAFRAGRPVPNVRCEQTPKGFYKITA
jgi:hypothetical protein